MQIIIPGILKDGTITRIAKQVHYLAGEDGNGETNLYLALHQWLEWYLEIQMALHLRLNWMPVIKSLITIPKLSM